jgi:hypothetical protein
MPNSHQNTVEFHQRGAYEESHPRSTVGEVNASLGVSEADPIRTADAIKNFTFHAGDEVILAEGPNKYLRGKFLRLKDDVKWACD